MQNALRQALAALIGVTSDELIAKSTGISDCIGVF